MDEMILVADLVSAFERIATAQERLATSSERGLALQEEMISNQRAMAVGTAALEKRLAKEYDS